MTLTPDQVRRLLEEPIYSWDVLSLLSGIVDYLEFSEQNLALQRQRDVLRAQAEAASLDFGPEDAHLLSQAREQIVESAELRFDIGLSQSVLESLLPRYERSEDQSSWQEDEFDQFKFIGHELFLYSLAIYLRAQDFESAAALLTQPYYSAGRTRSSGNPVSSFMAFWEYLRSLERRNKRLELRRLSLRADILEKRSKSSSIPFQSVMQADFVCFMRAEFDGPSKYDRWWPETLLYSRHSYGAFEIFARAVSKTYLKKVLPLFGVPSLEPVKAKLEEFSADKRSLPRWEFQSFSPSALMAFDSLGTKV